MKDPQEQDFELKKEGRDQATVWKVGCTTMICPWILLLKRLSVNTNASTPLNGITKEIGATPLLLWGSHTPAYMVDSAPHLSQPSGIKVGIIEREPL